MPGAKAKSGSGGAARKGRAGLRRNASGAFLVAAGAGAAARMAIPVETKTIRALSKKGKLIGHLLETYGAALERSQRTGRAVRFTVDVEPAGTPRITPVEMVGEAQPGAAEFVGGGELDRSLAAARERGRSRVAEILSGQDMLSADDLAQLLGTTRATVNTKRQNHQLLALEGAKRGFRFPDWQIGEDGKPFEALPTLFERLGGSPWAVYRFLVQHHPELDGQTGRDALRQGRSAEVIEAADSVAQAFA